MHRLNARTFMMRKLKIIISLAGMVIYSITSTPALAVNNSRFYSDNDILFYDPSSNSCSADPQNNKLEGGNVPEYSNPVYKKEQVPDPSTIVGDDNKYYVFGSGGILLRSDNLVSWSKISKDWNLKGSPNEAGGAKWAPDVAKVGSKYFLTYTIPSGTPEVGGAGKPSIGYAVSDKVDGPYKYKGKLPLPPSYAIDSHIFVDDDSRVWLFWGGGTLRVIELSISGEVITLKGESKDLLTKGKVGGNTTIEGSWVEKYNGWYYLMYSEGDWRAGGVPYRVVVAKSQKVNEGYQPNNSLRPILEGSGKTKDPGHNSVVKDISGTTWIVYHGFYGNDNSNRMLMIDPITYQDGWPVVNNGKGSSVTSLGSSAQGSDVTTGNVALQGNDNTEKAWNFLKQKGLSNEQAAGIIGNLLAESGLDPKAKNGSSYYGIAQWSANSRWAGLVNWAKGKNMDPWTLDAQLNYLWKEATERGQIDGIKKNSEQDISHLTWYWGRYFEVATIKGDPDKYPSNVQHFKDSREPKAKDVFTKFSGSPVPETSLDTPKTTDTCAPDSGTQAFSSIDGVTVYNQEDQKWASKPYGTSTVKSSGCGPTAMATIITALTGKSVTPIETVTYANEKNIYVPGQGSSWSLAPILAEHWGLKSKNITNSVVEINKVLQAGGMVITSGTGKAPFTSAGHYIAIRGVTSSGKWLVADSNGSTGQNNSKKEWEPTDILGTANAGNIVAISK